MNDAKTMMKNGAAALLLLVQLLGLTAPAAARYIANPDPTPDGGGSGSGPFYEWKFPAAGFSWAAPPRFYNWMASWHERGATASWPTETYIPTYVNPSAWPITVMGCQTENDFLANADPEGYAALQEEDKKNDTDLYPDQTTRYRWQWNGETTGFTKDCYGDLPFPGEGTYQVTLTIKTDDGDEQSYTLPVEVKDFLVVVLGDSSASGEGAPDVPLDPENPVGRAEWVDNRCHRSNNAGGAQAAERIERRDKKTSVTFLSFACSGATLAKDIYDTSMPDPYNPSSDYRGIGMVGPYAGIEPLKDSEGHDDFSQKLPSQVDQLWNALTDSGKHKPRKIDALIVAGGINDARFADLASVCVLSPFCYGTRVGVLGPNTRTLNDQFLNHDVKDIPGGWDALNNALTAPRTLNDGTSATLQFDSKLALQYPPFLHDDDGDRCVYVLYQAVPFWFRVIAFLANPAFPVGWTADEIDSAINDWAPALDENVRLGAERNGFDYVDTIANRFYYHGICADNRYINDPLDSALAEGNADGEDGKLSTLQSKGSAHPNTKGYAAYADEILRHLGALTKTEGNLPPKAVLDKVAVTQFSSRTFNVLDNDSDADPADVLSTRIVSQPLHGTATMQLDGTTTYKPTGSFIGTDTFVYELTDGQDVRTGGVSLTVDELHKNVVGAIGGEITVIGGLLAGYSLEPPYRIVFDKPLRSEYGTAQIDPHTGTLEYMPPPLLRKRIRLNYTLYSDTGSPTSPSYGESIRGTLILKVRRAH